jgi:hypothetical protein
VIRTISTSNPSTSAPIDLASRFFFTESSSITITKKDLQGTTLIHNGTFKWTDDTATPKTRYVRFAMKRTMEVKSFDEERPSSSSLEIE